MAALLSQSAKPVVQVMPQILAAQVAVPPVALHAVGQVPQWFLSVTVLISQPSASLLALQSAKPDAHAPLHTPAAQVRVGTFVVEQTPAQVPQCKGSVVVLISQPLATLLSQLAKPAAQLMPQVLAAQLAVPFVVLQTFVQVPQLFLSVVTLISQPFDSLSLLQSTKPVLHVPLQVPAKHVRVCMFVFEQALVQLPQ